MNCSWMETSAPIFFCEKRFYVKIITEIQATVIQFTVNHCVLFMMCESGKEPTEKNTST